MKSKRWCKKDIQDVISKYNAGVDARTIAVEFGRPVASVRTLIYRHISNQNKGTDREKLDCMPNPFRKEK